MLAHPPELRCTTSHADQTLTRLTAKSVEILILKDVLHHFENPASAVRQFARYLTDRGMLLVIEPYYALGDGESCNAIRELDNTSFKHNLLAACEWELVFAPNGLVVLDRKLVPPGVIDNNDGFPRIAWLLGRRYSKGWA